MSTKSKIVVCRASYCKVFSTIFRRVSFSTATRCYASMAHLAPLCDILRSPDKEADQFSMFGFMAILGRTGADSLERIEGRDDHLPECGRLGPSGSFHVERVESLPGVFMTISRTIAVAAALTRLFSVAAPAQDQRAPLTYRRSTT